MRASISCITAAGLALASVGAVRADPALDYTIGLGVGHDDNVNLSHTDPVGADMITPELTFDVKEQGAALSANAAGSVSYLDYLGHSPYGDQFRGLVSGVGDWALSPERIDWVAEDYLGRQPINVLAPSTQDNQQQTNVFSTGPTLRARFSEALRGRLDLRYTNTWADKNTTFDSNRWSGAGTLSFLLDAVNSVSASATGLRVRYREREAEPFDYDRNDLLFGYQRTTPILKLDVDGGYSRLDLRGSGDRSGPALHANLHWTPSRATDLSVDVERRFSDASEDLIIDPAEIAHVGIGSAHNGAVISPQLYVEKFVRLELDHSFTNVRVSVAPFWRQLDYIESTNLEDGDLSQHSTGYLASVAWQPHPTWTLAATTGRERRRYGDLGRTDDDASVELGLIWQRTSHWIWSLDYVHFDRDSTLSVASYSDNLVTLSLVYKR
ncbi:MAG TPA: outer membrane beta-barrel protein [Dokdonella sp.]